MSTSPLLPGRLGDPEMTLAADSRADPRMLETEEVPLAIDASIEELLAYHDALDAEAEVYGDAGAAGLPPVTGVAQRTEVIKGLEGNEIAGGYSQCPYISGTYSPPPPELTSLRENEGYMLDLVGIQLMANLYDPSGELGVDTRSRHGLPIGISHNAHTRPLCQNPAYMSYPRMLFCDEMLVRMLMRTLLWKG